MMSIRIVLLMSVSAPRSSRKKSPAKSAGLAKVDLSALIAAHCILQSADRVLHLAGSLVDLAFSFQLLVAEDLSGGFFHGSLGLLCRTLDSIFVHCCILAVLSDLR